MLNIRHVVSKRLWLSVKVLYFVYPIPNFLSTSFNIKRQKDLSFVTLDSFLADLGRNLVAKYLTSIYNFSQPTYILSHFENQSFYSKRHSIFSEKGNSKYYDENKGAPEI